MLKSILEVGRQMEDCMPVKEVILLSCPDVSVELCLLLGKGSEKVLLLSQPEASLVCESSDRPPE